MATVAERDPEEIVQSMISFKTSSDSNKLEQSFKK